jgi:hypothetical protein
VSLKDQDGEIFYDKLHFKFLQMPLFNSSDSFFEKIEEILNSEENVVSDKQLPLKKDFHEATRNDFRKNVHPFKTAKKFSVFYWSL